MSLVILKNSQSTQQYENANNYSSHYYNENTDYYQSKFSTASLNEKKERERGIRVERKKIKG